MWRVERHGGRSTDRFRVIIETDNEQKARQVYLREYRKMRQGAIRLLQDDKIVMRYEAPLLRTRW